MSYHALARKYRPETFAEVVGQTHVTGTLRAALRKQKLSHAYLLAGPRGCGKTTVARLLAKALNCSAAQDGAPCGKCDTCRNIAEGSYLDVLEIDAASNTGVDNIRDLRDMAQYSPTKGGCRVFIIDEVHMLSKGAFNALLKILEEPPPRVFFFFATTEPTKIPRTILSRCQRFDFRLLTREELTARIEAIAAAEDTALEADGLRLIVALAEGSMRDGLSILDQLIAGSEGPIDEQQIVDMFGLVRSEVYGELNEAIIARDAGRALRLVDQLLKNGQGLDTFALGIVTNFRNLLHLRIDPALATTLDVSPEQIDKLQQQAEHFHAQDLLALIDRAGLHYERIHRSSQPRILLEASLVEYTLFESRVLLSDLVRRVGELTGADLPGTQGASGASGKGGGDAASSRSPATKISKEAGGPAKAAPLSAADPRPAGVELSGGTGTESVASAAGASAAETVPGWTGFVQTLLNSHPGLASCLLDGLPSLDADGDRLLIAFEPGRSFQMERLASERAILQERIKAHWGKHLKLELVTGTPPGSRELTESVRRQVAPTEQEALAAACQEDAELADLVSLLKGEPVSASERDLWHGENPNDQPRQGQQQTAAQQDILPPARKGASKDN